MEPAVIGGNLNACPQQEGCSVAYSLMPRSNKANWKFILLHIFNNGQDEALKPTG
jgi:hypothetical protein